MAEGRRKTTHRSFAAAWRVIAVVPVIASCSVGPATARGLVPRIAVRGTLLHTSGRSGLDGRVAVTASFDLPASTVPTSAPAEDDLP